MERAEIAGEHLPWRDVLWTGRIPVPGGPRDERFVRALGSEPVVL